MYPGNIGSQINLACSLQKVLFKTKKKKKKICQYYVYNKKCSGVGKF